MDQGEKDAVLQQMKDSQLKNIDRLKKIGGDTKDIDRCNKLLEIQEMELLDVGKIAHDVSAETYWKNLQVELEQTPANWKTVMKELVLIQRRLCGILSGDIIENANPDQIQNPYKAAGNDEQKIQRLNSKTERNLAQKEVINFLRLTKCFEQMKQDDYYKDLPDLFSDIVKCFKLVASDYEQEELDIWLQSVYEMFKGSEFYWTHKVPRLLNQILCRLDQLEFQISQYNGITGNN